MEVNRAIELISEVKNSLESMCQINPMPDITGKLDLAVQMLQSTDEDPRIVNLRAWMESARAGNCFIRPIDILEFLNG